MTMMHDSGASPPGLQIMVSSLGSCDTVRRVKYIRATRNAFQRFASRAAGDEFVASTTDDLGHGRTYSFRTTDGHNMEIYYDTEWYAPPPHLKPALKNQAQRFPARGVNFREDVLRGADIFLENGIYIETGPHKHAIQQTFFLYVYEPGGNRVEVDSAGARLVLAPDWQPVVWTEAERKKGQAWGLKTIESFHTYGTPPIEECTGPRRT
jgi:hypothetical protein